MPINWKLGLAPKNSWELGFFPTICWDFGISQKLTGIVKNPWELGFVLKINWELGFRTPHQDPQLSLVQLYESQISVHFVYMICSYTKKHILPTESPNLLPAINL